MKKIIAFTGGGTGGHVYPALAVIEKLKDKEYDYFWIGSKKGIEYRIAQKEKIPFQSIPSGKLRRYFSFQNFLDVFKVGFGVLASIGVLIKKRPGVLFSKGGFVTVPPVIAAKLLKIPVITHESDFDPGLATRINSRFAKKILVPYEETKKYFSTSIRERVIVTGNPVRNDFFRPDRERGHKKVLSDASRPVILVLGGSLGAKKINDLIKDSLDELTRDYYVVHQMGEKNYEPSERENYYAVPFFSEDMAHIIAASDIVISRAGAGAIWEFVTSETPSLLIPLDNGSRGDQPKNAAYFKEKGTSLVLEEECATPDLLLNTLKGFFSDKEGMESMKKSCRSFKEKNCAETISRMITGELK